MTFVRSFPLALAAALLAGHPSGAVWAGRVRILSPAELAPLLGSVSLLDARAPNAFRAGHVPGSLRVDWRDFTLERPGTWSFLTGDPARWGKVPSADGKLEKRLRALGLSNGKSVVVVGEPGGWGEEGRIGWNLLYWGADDVALLDGGFAAWAAEGRPAEKGEAPAPPPGDFTLRLRPERRIELEPLRKAVSSGDRLLLDARTPEEFAGERLSGQRRGGHLPGASLVPARDLYRKDGRYAGAEELRIRLPLAVLAERAAPVAYCTGGVRSALLALLLEARLGVLAANYDGSIWEWSARPELPLAVP